MINKGVRMSELDSEKGIGKTIATKVPMNIHEELIGLVNSGAYLSISDFLREAIRNELALYKINDIRDIKYMDAKKEVLSYFMKFHDCYLDEIDFDLELDFDLVSRILKDLLREGRIILVTGKSILEEIEEKNFDGSDYNLIKLEGKRIIIQSKSTGNRYITLRHDRNNNTVLKSKDEIVFNGTAILSKCYSFVK